MVSCFILWPVVGKYIHLPFDLASGSHNLQSSRSGSVHNVNKSHIFLLAKPPNPSLKHMASKMMHNYAYTHPANSFICQHSFRITSTDMSSLGVFNALISFTVSLEARVLTCSRRKPAVELELERKLTLLPSMLSPYTYSYLHSVNCMQ